MPFRKLFKRNPHHVAQPPATYSAGAVVSPWEAQNQEAIDELARFIDFAEGFTIGFIEINFVNDLDILLKVLRNRSECQAVQFQVIDLSDPNIKYLQDELIQRLPPPTQTPVSMLLEEKRVLVLTGLENAIGMFGDYPTLLQDLNFVRDALMDSVPYPVLFCLPSYAINRIIQFAPDFWSWKSGLFKVTSVQSSEDNASIRALHATKLLGSLNQFQRQERIQLLERLAQEFSPLEGHRSKDDLRVCAKALVQLGILHINFGEYPKGKEALDKAQQIFESPNWVPEIKSDLLLKVTLLNWLGIFKFGIGYIDDAEKLFQTSIDINNGINAFEKAHSLGFLGQIKASQGQLDEAIALYQESLEICEQIDDFQGRAACLRQIGDLKAQRGNLDAAITLSQESLAIYKQISHEQGKIIVLHQIANYKDAEGKRDAAMELYQESLDICEQMGYVQFKSANLQQIARLKANRGQVEDAIALYQESLSISEQIGDAQGKAKSLWWLGRLAAQKGDFATAIPDLQESLAILQRMGSPDTANVQSLLERTQRLADQ